MKKFLVYWIAFIIIQLLLSIDCNAFSGSGSGTSGDPYQITDVSQLQEMNDNKNAYYILMNDIDASVTSSWNNGAGFVPIGTEASRFYGKLNGAGFAITGLYINRPTTPYIGLFGCIGNGSKIENVGLENSIMTGYNYVGSTCGRNYYGVITNCYSNGITNSTSTVYGDWGYTGGLCGWNSGSITNSFSKGSVSGKEDMIGGFVGFNWGPITKCYSTCDVSGSWGYLGGFVGLNYGGASISYCFSTGTVSGIQNVGGFCGWNYDSGSSINNCYSTGAVSAKIEVGGFCGVNYYGCRINNCYSMGSVNGNTSVGGFCGYNYSSISNSFWDTETSGKTTSYGGTGKTTAQMKTQSTFTGAGWDFSTIWCMCCSIEYPKLKFSPDITPPKVVTKNITISLDATGLSTITEDQIDDGSSDNCGIASMSVNPNSFTCSEVGTNTVTLTVTDIYGNSSSATSLVSVQDNLSPTALSKDITVYLDNYGSASISATDVDNNSYDNCGISSVTVSPMTFSCSDVGQNKVTLSVTDVNGNQSGCTSFVTVNDNIFPTISVSLSSNLLWPPNHKMVEIEANVEVQDNCNYSIVRSIVSNESDNGLDDGDTPYDIQDGIDDEHFSLRAERSGNGNGRTYTVTFTATDASGNISSASSTISVPYSKARIGDENPDALNSQNEFGIQSIYPNPFNNSTTLLCNLSEKGEFLVEIYNSVGMKIRTLLFTGVQPGYNYIVWDGKDNIGQLVPEGIYFCKLIAGYLIDTKGISVIR